MQPPSSYNRAENFLDSDSIDWQTYVAGAVVALTLLIFLIRLTRTERPLRKLLRLCPEKRLKRRRAHCRKSFA